MTSLSDEINCQIPRPTSRSRSLHFKTRHLFAILASAEPTCVSCYRRGAELPRPWQELPSASHQHRSAPEITTDSTPRLRWNQSSVALNHIPTVVVDGCETVIQAQHAGIISRSTQCPRPPRSACPMARHSPSSPSSPASSLRAMSSTRITSLLSR